MNIIQLLLALGCLCCASCGHTDTTSPRLYIKPDYYDGLNPLVLSPDRASMLTAGSDGVIRLWQVAEGTLIREYHGHQQPVTSLAFSADGSRFVSGGWDKTTRIWSISNDYPIHTLRGHDYAVQSVWFAQDGLTVTSKSIDGMVRTWDTHTGAGLLTLMTLNDGGWIAYADDHRFHGSTGSDGFVRWRVDGSKVYREDLNRQYHDATGITRRLQFPSAHAQR